MNTGLEVLKTYDAGSSRAELCPIDEAVVAVGDDPAAKRGLEKELLEVLGQQCALAATEYICSKLALIGSDVSVPALADLLSHPQLSTAARTALEDIPGGVSLGALRKAATKLSGLQRIGAIQSLGIKRDIGSVGMLSKHLRDPETELASACAYALGQIGSEKAAAALKAFLSVAPKPLQLKTADAALVCAERLLADGRRAEAESLYRILAAKEQPKHVQQGAAIGLSSCAAARNQMPGT